MVKLYEQGKVDDTTMVKMAVFKEKVAELMKEAISPADKKTLLLGAAISAGAGLGAAAVDAVSDYFLSRRAKSSLDEETEKVFEELYSSPEVSKYPKNIAQQYFQTLKHFSPHIATDPLSAKTYLLQMLDWEDAQTSTPISTVQVRDLAEIEAKSMDALAKRPASKFEISRFTDPLVGAVSEEPKNLYTKYKFFDSKNPEEEKKKPK
jgi:hypothetical protein